MHRSKEFPGRNKFIDYTKIVVSISKIWSKIHIW